MMSEMIVGEMLMDFYMGLLALVWVAFVLVVASMHEED